MADHPGTADDLSSGGSPATGLAPTDTGYSVEGVPTFEAVRDRIEARWGASQGAAELDAETASGREVAEQYAARERAAAQRLAAIRAAMRGEDTGR